MLSTNPGLKSRFSERVHFHNFNANATTEMLLNVLEMKRIPFEMTTTSHHDDIGRLSQRLVESADFGNGRDVMTWADRVFKEIAKGRSKQSKQRAALPRRDRHRTVVSTLAHIKAALDHMLKSRVVPSGGQRCASLPEFGNDADARRDEHAAAPPPQKVELAQQTQFFCEEVEPEPEPEESLEEEDANLFESIDPGVLQTLQTVLDEERLNSQDGIRKFAGLDPDGPDFHRLLQRLVSDLGMDPESARRQLIAWQDAQKQLEKQLQAQKQKKMGARPIWRCAVCGAANLPHIVCWVAPYIVGYEKVPVD